MLNIFRKLGQTELLEKEAELAVLSADLKNIGDEVVLNEWTKDKIRSNLLGNIADNQLELPENLFEVGRGVSKVAQGQYLTAGQKKLIYCSIVEAYPVGLSKTWQFWMRTFRTALASLLIVLFSLTFLVITPIDLRMTKAAKWTFLEDVRGDVFVNRGGRILSVNKNFTLEQGDLVFTQADSFVVIRFLDDSVARLGGGTSLELNKLYARPENLASTDVQLSLVGGQIWASVYNLVDEESKFVVETENASARVNSKAAFELKTKDKTTSLAVYDNVVDFSRKSTRINEVQPVLSGFKAEVDSSKVYQLAYNDYDVVIQKNTDTVDDWAKLNMNLDKQHEQLLKDENIKFIAQVSDKDASIVGVLSDVKDTTKLIFNNAEIEQARIRFINAHLGFIKAEQIINDAGISLEKRRLALPLIYDYKSTVKDIMAEYADLQKKDATQAQKLFDLMKGNFDAQRKALSLVMPEENLYTAKFVMNEVAADFAINDSEKNQFYLAQAREKLFEVQTLIGHDDLKGAEVGFESYLTNLDNLVGQINKVKADNVESQLFDLINEQVKQFKVLNDMEKKLAEKDDKILLALVKRVNSSNLEKLLVVFKSYRKNGVPFEVLSELNNTIENYFPVGDERNNSLLAMKDLMKTYPEYQELKQPVMPEIPAIEVSPDKVGLILDFQATQDVSVDDNFASPQNPDNSIVTKDSKAN